MKRHLRKICRGAVCLLLAVLLLPAGQVQAGAYVADEDGSLLPVPEAYEVYDSIYNLGEYGVMSHPQDLFVDGGDIYVTDTDNNRVLKMDMQGTVEAEFTEAFGKISLRRAVSSRIKREISG